MNNEAINEVEINGGPAVPLVIPPLPPREADPTPRWLLEVDLGGSPVRLSTSEVTVPSRTDGAGGRLYARGLPSLEVPLGADSLTVQVPLLDAYARARQVRQLVGRQAVLRYYRGEPVLEDAVIVLRGVVSGVRYGDPSAPDAVQLELRRSDLVGSTTMLPPGWVVDGDTWLQDVYRSAPQVLGAAYPLVIGCPGRPSQDGGTDYYPAVPAACVDTTPGARILLVAGHPTEATRVKVWDLSGGIVTDVGPVSPVVSLTDDASSQPCSTAALVGASIDPPDNSALYTSWLPRDGDYGAGVLFEGEPIRGLGTLLLWGSLEYARDPVDRGALRSWRDELDQYEIDAFVNDPAVSWDDWVRANILDLFGVERMDGPDGLWYRPAVYRPQRARVRATLVTDRTAAGHLVKVGGYGQTADDLATTITVQYAPRAASRSYDRRWTLAPERDPDDDRVVGSALCRRALEVLGGRTAAVSRECPVTAHPGTALRLAQRLAERYALPADEVTIEGGPRLAGLQPYDTVEIVDHMAPGPVLGVVQPGLVLGERAVSLRVRVPTT